VLEQLLGIVAGIDDLDQVAQPADLPVGLVTLLVGPVGGEAELVGTVHFMAADLHLHPHRVFVDQRGVERTVTVRLGGRDIVLEASGDHLPGGVEYPQRLVAIGLAVGQHPEGHDIGDLFERDVAFGHLLPDRIGVLFAPRNLDLEPCLGQRLLDRKRDRIDLPALARADLREPAGDRGIGLRLELLESEQLHLAHVFVHPHALGQGGVDIHRFAGDAAALFLALDEMQRAHVVEPVGQLDEEDADVLAHRQEELAQVFRCALVLGHRLDLGELGHAIDQPGDIGAEQPLNLLDSGERVLDRIVKQRGDDGFLIELELGHQPGNLDRVAEVGIAAGALLGAVLLYGVDIGTVEHRLVGFGVIAQDPLDQFELAQHRRLDGGKPGHSARGKAA
jgi:hypothetical protein